MWLKLVGHGFFEALLDSFIAADVVPPHLGNLHRHLPESAGLHSRQRPLKVWQCNLEPHTAVTSAMEW